MCLHHTDRERVTRVQTSQIELVIDFDESRQDDRGWYNDGKAYQHLTPTLQFGMIESTRLPPTCMISFTLLFYIFHSAASKLKKTSCCFFLPCWKMRTQSLSF